MNDDWITEARQLDWIRSCARIISERVGFSLADATNMASCALEDALITSPNKDGFTHKTPEAAADEEVQLWFDFGEEDEET